MINRNAKPATPAIESDVPASMAKVQLLCLSVVAVLAGCGSGGDSISAAPPAPPVLTEALRIAAASATVTANSKCSTASLGAYYWEIGDASGVKASGSVGGGAPAATTAMWVFSASKWLYAANVVQKRGVQASDVPYLNFTSGYSRFGNLPLCVGSTTVEGCMIGRDGQDPGTVNRFAYDSGHMQQHALAVMGLGAADNAALAADLNATVGTRVGNPGFSYTVQQLAAGVVVTPQGYGQFLRGLLRNDLALGAALGSNKVCAQSASGGCNAAFTPDSVGSEGWSYSLGHWVEDDPAIGDHAFSSPGGGGFYPWIDSSKTYYGIVARERDNESAAGYHSAECGRLIRQAWRTGLTVTATVPSP